MELNLRAERCSVLEALVMTIIENIIAGWVFANLALPIWLLWRRSPHFRHRLYLYTLGGLHPSRDRELAHVLIETARQRGSLHRCKRPA